MPAAFALALVMLASLVLMSPHDALDPPSNASPLPKVAPAPEFSLTSQDGVQVKLVDFRGKVVVVTFIFTMCTTTCPVLTPMLSFVQERLGRDFGEKIAFISITLDPERDTPDVLREYAQAFGANLAGWAFLTGPPAAIREVTRRYGVFASKDPNGDVDHTSLTSIIDPRGILRVQYLGARFNPEEFQSDLLSLVDEQ
jgi:protein SCO1